MYMQVVFKRTLQRYYNGIPSLIFLSERSIMSIGVLLSPLDVLEDDGS